MTTPNLIAVPGLNSEVAGAIVYWRLADVTATTALRTALGASGIAEEHLPPYTSPDAALRRTMYRQRGPHRLVRNVAGAWHIVDENEVEGSPTYRADLRVALADDGLLAITPTGTSPAWVADINAEFAAALEHVSQHEVSAWLVRQAYRLGAVALRDTGGIYFVPRTALDNWHALVEAVRAATKHTIFEVPALKSDEAVAAVLDAVRAEAAQASEALAEELNTGKLGERGLRARQQRCEDVLAKLASYEALLGVSLDDIKAKVETLQGEVVAAVMLAEAANAAA